MNRRRPLFYEVHIANASTLRIPNGMPVGQTSKYRPTQSTATFTIALRVIARTNSPKLYVRVSLLDRLGTLSGMDGDDSNDISRYSINNIFPNIMQATHAGTVGPESECIPTYVGSEHKHTFGSRFEMAIQQTQKAPSVMARSQSSSLRQLLSKWFIIVKRTSL
jgi:hypothetical protein